MRKTYNLKTRIAAAVACFALGFTGFAQTTLISPTGDGGFENGGTFAANNWSVSNSANNPWVIGVSGAVAPVTGNSAFISNDGGVTNAYTQGNNATNYFWRDITVPAGETKIILSYNWRSQGEASYDIIQVFVAPTSITPVAVAAHPGIGTTNVPPGIAGATNVGFNEMGGAATVNTSTILLPASLAGTTFRLIFSWKNETGGAQPPATIDNISLVSQVPGNFISVLSGNWSTASTWNAGAVPTPVDNVTISSGNVVTLNTAGPAANNVIINGTLTFGTTPTSFTASGDLFVSSTGILEVFNGTTGKNLTVSGNLTNNGVIDLSKGTSGTTSVLTLNGSTVQTVSGTGTFATNVIRNLTFNNTATAIPNIHWFFNNISIAANLTFTSGKVNLSTNKMTLGTGTASGTGAAAVGALTAPVGQGFMPGGTFSRWYTTASTGTSITAGTDPTNATSRYPFLNSAAQNRAMYITRAASGTAGGQLSVKYNDGTGMSAVAFTDGTYNIDKIYNGNWVVSTEGTGITSASYGAYLIGQGAYTAANGNTRIVSSTGPVSGTNQLGTTTPAGYRTGISLSDLTNPAGLFLGISNADFVFPCSGTPAAGTVSSTANPACPGVNFTLSVTGATTGVTGLTYQWQSSTDGTSFTNIGGATSATYVANQMSAMYYQLIVTCTSGGAADTTPSLMIPMNIPTNCYCVPTFTDGIEPITSVVLGSINNVTSATIGGTPALENFTAMSTSMGQGTVSVITVKGNTGGNWSDSVVVFADWNQDGDFIDSGEKFRIGVLTNTTGVDAISVTGNITVPGTATLGNTRLRVMKQYGTAVVNPCRTGTGYGQAEDYTVTVTLPPPCVAPSSLTATSITTTTASLGWNCTSCTGTFALEYGPTGFTAGTGTIINPAVSPVAVSGLTANTAYQFYVVQDCGGGSFSTAAGPFTFSTKKPGDDICDTITLTTGANGPFSNVGNTVQTGEAVPPVTTYTSQNGWGNNTLENTMWFKFTAPASGRVSISSTGFDTQLAIWAASTCGALTTGAGTLVAANDDLNGTVFTSFVSAANCLTPGATYFVQVDGWNGSTGNATVTLTDLGAANASFTGLNTSYCAGSAAVTLTPATAGGTFSGTGVTGSSFNPATAGVGTHTIKYKLTACDSTMQTVTVNALPSVSGMSDDMDNIVCAGTMVTLTGSGADSYTWAGATTVTDGVAFTPSATGTYTVTGTATATGCMNTATVTVTVNALPAVAGISDDMDNMVCAGTMVTLTGTGADSYTWAGATTVTDGVAFTPSATDTYTVTGTTTATGCVNTATVTVTVESIPAVTGVSDDMDNIVCAGTMVTLTGSGANTYTWSGATAVTNGVAFTPSATDTYTVTGTTAGGCSGTATVTVTVNALPSVAGMSDDMDNIVCAGTMVTLTGSGADSYTWAGTTTVTDGVAFTPSATDTYTVTGTTTATGCMNTATVTVTVNALPAVAGMSDDMDNMVCAGTMVTLTGSGADSYTWAGTTTVTDGVAFTPSATDTYTVTGTTTATGCMNTATVTVTVESTPAVTGMSDDMDNMVCAGTMVTLTGSGANTYTWSGATAVTNGVAFTPSATDTYTVTGTTAGGCSGTATVTVTVNSLPSSTIAPFTVPVCDNGGPISLNGGSPAGGVYIGIGVSGSTFDPTGLSGLNQIGYTVTDANGCSAYDSTYITVDVCSGITADNSSEGFNVYPNPANGIINITVSSTSNDQVRISIVDLQGKEVYNETYNNISGKYSKQVNIENLAKGIYYIKMNTDKESRIEKLIVH
ncbi:MAG TPA: T9SS type A sorting domain-containing protein [Bacteroidia bacterium]